MKNISALLIAFLMLGSMLFAQEEPLQIKCMSTTGNKIYVGTNKGLFVSADEGSNWTYIYFGLPKMEIRKIASYGESVAVSNGRYIYLSLNAGKDWKELVHSSIESAYAVDDLSLNKDGLYVYGDKLIPLKTENNEKLIPISALASENFKAGNAYINDQVIVFSDGKNVRISTDKGTSFTPSVLPHNYMRQIAVAENFVFIANQDGGVYKSYNSAEEWKAVNKDLPSDDKQFRQVFQANNKIFLTNWRGEVFLFQKEANTWEKLEGNTKVIGELASINGKLIFANISDKNELTLVDKTGEKALFENIEKSFYYFMSSLAENDKSDRQKGIKTKKPRSQDFMAYSSVIKTREEYSGNVYKNTEGKNFGNVEYVVISKKSETCEDCVPKPLHEKFPGLWKDGVDDALTLGNYIYFFRGMECMRWDISANKMEEKSIIQDHFPGIAGDIDGVLEWGNSIYFFIDEYYYKFSKSDNSVYSGYPRKVVTNWGFAPETYSSLSRIRGGINWDNGFAYLIDSKYGPFKMELQTEKNKGFAFMKVMKKTGWDNFDGVFNLSREEVIFFKNPGGYNKLSQEFTEKRWSALFSSSIKAKEERMKPGMTCMDCGGSGKGKDFIYCTKCKGSPYNTIYNKSQMTKDVFGRDVPMSGSIGTTITCTSCWGTGGHQSGCKTCGSTGKYLNTGQTDITETSEYINQFNSDVSQFKSEIDEIFSSSKNKFESLIYLYEETTDGVDFYSVIKPTSRESAILQGFQINGDEKRALSIRFEPNSKYSKALGNGSRFEKALYEVISDKIAKGEYKRKGFAHESGMTITEITDSLGNRVVDIYKSMYGPVKFVFYSSNWGKE